MQYGVMCRLWTDQHRVTSSCPASICSPSGSLTVPTFECLPSRSCMLWASCPLHTCHPLSRMRRRAMCQTTCKPCSNYRSASHPQTLKHVQTTGQHHPSNSEPCLNNRSASHCQKACTNSCSPIQAVTTNSSKLICVLVTHMHVWAGTASAHSS